MRRPGIYMRRTRDRPCDKLVAFQLSIHLFSLIFQNFLWWPFFRHALIFLLPLKIFLPPSINFPPPTNFFTHSSFFYPPKIFLPLCCNILLSLQKLTQYIVNMTRIKFLNSNDFRTGLVTRLAWGICMSPLETVILIGVIGPVRLRNLPRV